MSLKSTLLIIFLISFLISIVISTLFTTTQKEKIFEVKKGQSAFEVLNNLEQQKIIPKNIFMKPVFLLFSDLKAGYYYIEKNETLYNLIKKLTKGTEYEINITIPEGKTIKEIEDIANAKFKEIVEKYNIEKIELKLSNLKASDFKDEFSFLDDAESLEGFLFPDTYKIPFGIDEKNFVRIMLKNFEKKATPVYENYKENLKGKDIKDLYNVLKIASILEKEVKNKEDKKIVAGILWKRIENNMLLQVDATLNYILEEKKPALSGKDLEIDSPYNTYKYKGLPPTPIANPGIESIEAALNPIESDYWFYLTTKDGKTIFSKTFEEHKQNKFKFLR